MSRILRATLLMGLLLSVVLASPATAPVRNWKFIVIHHSATATGSASLFDNSHRARGMVNGLAYHFVISNGSEGLPDGFIEVGARWIRQLHGGHCRQEDVNDNGIGICLVGDFTNDRPTDNQMQSLVVLVKGLQSQFRIPDSHVVRHGEIFGEYSECPGKSFPWEHFRKRLKATKP